MRIWLRNKLLVCCAVAITMLGADVSASSLFDGSTAELWLVDPDTGRITGLNLSTNWTSDFINRQTQLPLYNLDGREQAYINNLNRSSIPMSPAAPNTSQPVISFAGLGDVHDDGGNGGQSDLDVSPASGAYTETIAVQLRVNTETIINEDVVGIYWTIGNGSEQRYVVQAEDLNEPGAPVRGGYYAHTLHLVRDGNYPISVELKGGNGQVLAATTRTYDLVSGHPDGFRRDTDGDGIPDLIEAAIGLDPLNDDWLVDSDGDGWSDFDEWLRTYCLDVNGVPDPSQGIACRDGKGNPIDTDDDGWADFDEKLRFTRHDDAVDANNVPMQDNETPTSESFLERVLNFKDFPTAHRLYEVERIVTAGNPLPAPTQIETHIVDQINTGAVDASFTGNVVQSFTPTADNINGVDVMLGGGGEVFDDLTLIIWPDPLRDGQPITVAQLFGVPTAPGTVAQFRFPAVALQPGAVHYLEVRATQAEFGIQTVPGNYASGTLIEANAAPADPLADLLFTTFADGTFTNGQGGLPDVWAWDDITASTVKGESFYTTEDLLFPGNISGVGLTFADIADRKEALVADQSLKNDELPPMRVPAGDSAVIGVTLRIGPPEITNGQAPDAFGLVHKTWLNRMPDATPKRLLDEQGAGNWQTPEEWRNAFVAYLRNNLTLIEPIFIDDRNTDIMTLIEGALSEEARLRGDASAVLFGGESFGTVPEDAETALERFGGEGYSLDDAVANFDAGSAVGQPLEPIANWIANLRTTLIPGGRSDALIADAFRQSFDMGCFVDTTLLEDLKNQPQAFSDFVAGCPNFFTEAELPALQLEDRRRLHSVRLFLLPGAGPQVGLDATLTDPDVDSDADQLLNFVEAGSPLPFATLPWLSDTDGDLLGDGDDPCPVEPFNECGDTPILPNVAPGADVIVTEPVGGSNIAIVSIVLDREYDEDIQVAYRPFTDTGDTANAGTDYDDTEGVVTIRAGERVALITVPVYQDGLTEIVETFSIEIIDADKAVIAGDGIIIVSINDMAGASEPIVIIADDNQTVDEGDPVTLDASASFDPGGEQITFIWQQINNGAPLVVLTGGNTALATFTAPDVQTTQSLVFDVTVTNESVLSATAQATVNVNQVNGPPFVTGTPSYQVIVDNTLELAYETLLAFVDDPDGDPLTIDAIVDQPAFGVLTDTGTGFEYDPDAGTGGGGAEPTLVQDLWITGSVNGSSLASPVVQTFVPNQLHPSGLDNLAGVDVLIGGSGNVTVTMKLWLYSGGNLRNGNPFVEVTRANVPRDEVIDFRFPAVAISPGFEYALEFIGPDGSVFGAINSNPYANGSVVEAGGIVQPGNDDLWFRTYYDENFGLPGGVTALQLSDPRIVDWILSGDNRTVVLQERDSSVTPGIDRIVAFDLATRTRTVLGEGEFPNFFGGFFPSPKESSSIWFNTGTPNVDELLHRYDPDAVQPLVTIPMPATAPTFVYSETAVDPRTGDLHYCDRDSEEDPITPRWYRVNNADLSVTPYGDRGCDGSRTMAPVRIGQRFCVLFDLSQVICTEPGGNELGIFTESPTEYVSNTWYGPGSTLDFNSDRPQDGIVQVGDAALIFLGRAPQFNTLTEVDVFLFHENSWVEQQFPGPPGEDPVTETSPQPTLLMTRSIVDIFTDESRLFNSVPEVQELPGGGAAITFATEGFTQTTGDEFIEMWKWDGNLNATALEQIDIGLVPAPLESGEFATNHDGKMQIVGGKLYWQVQGVTDDQVRYIYEVDTSGAPNALTLLQTVPGTLNDARPWQNERATYDILVAGPNTAGVLIDSQLPGICEIVNIADGSIAQEDVECTNHETVEGAGLLYEGVFEQNLFFIGLGGAPQTGQTSFSVEVSDTANNKVTLPVNVEVLPPL